MGVRGDLADALARLDAGLMLAMPLSRAMPSIGRAVHELRLRDRSGHYRVIYALGRRGTVHILHAFKKTTQTNNVTTCSPLSVSLRAPKSRRSLSRSVTSRVSPTAGLSPSCSTRSATCGEK